MSRKHIRAWLATILVFLAISSAERAAAKDELTSVLSTTGFVYLPLFVAEQLGYFEQENIDATLVVTGGEAKSLAAVLSGDAGIFVGTPSSVFRTRANGTDVTVIGAMTTQYASNVVVSKSWAEKHGITENSSYADKLKALKGATIGVTAIGSGTDMLVRFLARQAGLNPDRDLTITGMGSGETATAALMQDRIQGFAFASPAAEFAVKHHDAVMLFNLTNGDVKDLDGFLYIAVNARDSWLKKNPDLATRYLRALQRALDTIHDPKATQKARDAVWKKYHSKIDKEFYDSVWESSTSSFPTTVDVNAKMMQRIVEFMNEFEKSKFDPASLPGAWTDEFARRAAAPQAR